MKTVIKELIDELNELSNYYYTLSEYDTCHGIGIAVELIMTKLEREKQQISATYRVAKAEAKMFPELNTTGEQYYNQTYNE